MKSFDFFRVARLKRETTGLPVDIWVDDTGICYSEVLPLLIWFSGDKKNPTGSMISMIVSSSPVIPSGDFEKLKLDSLELLQIKTFVKANRKSLLKLADVQNTYDIEDFLKDIKKVLRMF